MRTEVSVNVYVEGIGSLRVYGYHYSHIGARDGKGGPPLEPDEFGTEITSITGPDGREIAETELEEGEYNLCMDALMETEADERTYNEDE